MNVIVIDNLPEPIQNTDSEKAKVSITLTWEEGNDYPDRDSLILKKK